MPVPKNKYGPGAMTEVHSLAESQNLEQYIPNSQNLKQRPNSISNKISHSVQKQGGPQIDMSGVEPNQLFLNP